jgi:glycosyltransferase involved in cell wall biosynthesis
VIITHNEAPRLRLVLESFAAQKADAPPFEVVVVDDGSSDGTAQVLAEAASSLPLRVVRHDVPQGRSAARNAGAKAAEHDTLIFLDGDCLAAPGFVARHVEAHGTHGAVMGRGETYHVRCTRFFRDPETGSPMPGEEARVARMSPAELDASRVTREQVRHRFDEIARRGEAGIYAGAGPRQLYELEMRALHEMPTASVLWMAASGHNFSVPRADFLAVDGYDARITINEHRELALRLQARGLRVIPVDGARSLHLLHRVGWRDPLVETDWERTFFQVHPTLATKLMSVFWLSLAGDKEIPEEARILSLERFEEIVQRGTTFDYDGLRRNHRKLVPLG